MPPLGSLKKRGAKHLLPRRHCGAVVSKFFTRSVKKAHHPPTQKLIRIQCTRHSNLPVYPNWFFTMRMQCIGGKTNYSSTFVDIIFKQPAIKYARGMSVKWMRLHKRSKQTGTIEIIYGRPSNFFWGKMEPPTSVKEARTTGKFFFTFFSFVFHYFQTWYLRIHCNKARPVLVFPCWIRIVGLFCI